MYDLFASEYGYSREEFLRMPVRMMNFLIDRIIARRHNMFAENLEYKAMIQGAKLKIPRILIDHDTKEQAAVKAHKQQISDEMAERVLKEAQERKRMEFKLG